jgi:hypothetical protein
MDESLRTTSTRPASSRCNSDLELPADFDPDQHPILACHWFGIDPQELRDLWWRQLRLGHRLPTEGGVIEGGYLG